MSRCLCFTSLCGRSAQPHKLNNTQIPAKHSKIFFFTKRSPSRTSSQFLLYTHYTGEAKWLSIKTVRQKKTERTFWFALPFFNYMLFINMFLLFLFLNLFLFHWMFWVLIWHIISPLFRYATFLSSFNGNILCVVKLFLFFLLWNGEF